MSQTEEQKRHAAELKASRDKVNARKQRTRRLIEHGALAESFIPGSEQMTGEQFKAALALYFSPTGRQSALTKENDGKALQKPRLEQMSW